MTVDQLAFNIMHLTYRPNFTIVYTLTDRIPRRISAREFSRLWKIHQFLNLIRSLMIGRAQFTEQSRKDIINWTD